MHIYHTYIYLMLSFRQSVCVRAAVFTNRGLFNNANLCPRCAHGPTHSYTPLNAEAVMVGATSLDTLYTSYVPNGAP